MPTVAEQLHAAREAKKLTIQQVADATKIRTDHIRALEEGNFDMFSAPVYIRGFVRNYATLLKLDVAQIMAALDTELGRTEKFKEPPPLVEESKTVLDHLMYWLAKLNWRVGFVGIAAVGIVLVVVLAGLAWRHHQRSHPTVNLPPAVYQTTNSGETLPLPKH
jgi:cytoskeletal protein RodZ